MKKWEVFVSGDINIDLTVPNINKFPDAGQEVLTKTMELNVGGGAALFALGLGKLGVKTVFKGLVGDDMFGKYIISEFESRKIDSSLLKVDSTDRTGISIGFTNEHDRSFVTYMGTNGKISFEDISESDIENTKHIHLTGYRGKENHDRFMVLLERIKKQGTTVSLDVGWDDTEQWSECIFETMKYIDVFFMNNTEALHYTRSKTVEEALHIISQYCDHIVIKLGADGSVAKKDGVIQRAEPFKVVSVDTTGAGDSFNAGYIYSFLKGLSLSQSLINANACGALSVTKYGGNAGFPLENELIDFTKSYK